MNEEDLKGFVESYTKTAMNKYEWDSYQIEEKYWNYAMRDGEETIILRIWWLKDPSTGNRYKFILWPESYAKVKIEKYNNTGALLHHWTRTGCRDFGRDEWSILVRQGCVADGTGADSYILNHNYALDA